MDNLYLRDIFDEVKMKLAVIVVIWYIQQIWIYIYTVFSVGIYILLVLLLPGLQCDVSDRSMTPRTLHHCFDFSVMIHYDAYTSIKTIFSFLLHSFSHHKICKKIQTEQRINKYTNKNNNKNKKLLLHIYKIFYTLFNNKCFIIFHPRIQLLKNYCYKSVKQKIKNII